MRRRHLALVGLLALVAFLFWRLLLRRAPADLPPPPLVAPVLPSPPDPPPPPPRPAAVDRPPARPTGAPLPPIIDDIVVEKAEVCDGDETLVTVKAHTEGNREDAYLHYTVGPELGASVPLRVFADDRTEGERPPLVVRVFGRNNVVTEHPLPPIRVMPCKPARRLYVTARVLPNSIDEFELSARIVNVTAGAPMRPVEARWSFGDGTTAVSQGPVIMHDFSGRPQESLYSQLLVACEAVAADGERVAGRTALQLLNPSFEHLAYRGIVLLYAVLTPRFPEIGPDGKVRQTAHVWHRYREPVTVLRVLRYAHANDGATTGEPVEVDPVRLFGTNVIGPTGADAKLELDPAAGVFSYELAIEGRTPDDLPAQGAFSILRPPDRPTKENSTPVVDPLLKAKIVRAREVLHQEYVTDEDLIRLGEQGAFDDLVQSAATRPPSGEPAPLPPAPAR